MTARKTVPAPATSPTATGAVEALAASASSPSTANPKDLVIAPNVRRDLRVDTEFVASVKEHGILVPVLVFEHNSKLHVLDGQRRTSAAVKAKLPSIPVHVVELASEDTARIITQVVVNDHRAQLTASDHAAAYQQLELAGLTVNQIGEKLSTRPALVSAGLRIRESEGLAELVDNVPVTLETAATLSELASIDQALYSSLIATINDRPAQADHAIARARRKLAELNARTELADLLRTAGYKDIRLVEQRPPYRNETQSDLDELTPEIAADDRDRPDPKLAGLVGFIHLEDDYDDQLQAEVTVPVVVWQIENYRDHGYENRYARSSTPAKTTSTTTEKPELTDEQKAQRELELEAKRQIRRNNADWTAATDVRIEYLKTIIAAKTAPKGWEEYVAEWLSYGDGFDYRVSEALGTLFDVPAVHGSYYNAKTEVRHRTIGRPWAFILGGTLVAMEHRIRTNTRGWDSTHAAAHLTQLAHWGYTLSDIESRVIDGTTTETAA